MAAALTELPSRRAPVETSAGAASRTGRSLRLTHVASVRDLLLVGFEDVVEVGRDRERLALGGRSSGEMSANSFFQAA